MIAFYAPTPSLWSHYSSVSRCVHQRGLRLGAGEIWRRRGENARHVGRDGAQPADTLLPRRDRGKYLGPRAGAFRTFGLRRAAPRCCSASGVDIVAVRVDVQVALSAVIKLIASRAHALYPRSRSLSAEVLVIFHALPTAPSAISPARWVATRVMAETTEPLARLPHRCGLRC